MGSHTFCPYMAWRHHNCPNCVVWFLSAKDVIIVPQSTLQTSLQSGNYGQMCVWLRSTTSMELTSGLLEMQCQCHPTQVNTPRHNRSQIDWYSIYLPCREGRLSWRRWLFTYWDGLPAHRWSPIHVITGRVVDHVIHYGMTAGYHPATRATIATDSADNYSPPPWWRHDDSLTSRQKHITGWRYKDTYRERHTNRETERHTETQRERERETDLDITLTCTESLDGEWRWTQHITDWVNTYSNIIQQHPSSSSPSSSSSSSAAAAATWPRSTAVTAWTSRRTYSMRQSTQLDPDAEKVHTLWKTGSWNALELSQHDEIFSVMRTRRWRFWQTKWERQCWCHGEPFRAAASVHQTSLNNNNSSSSRQVHHRADRETASADNCIISHALTTYYIHIIISTSSTTFPPATS